jgi:HlyD family secretion protein
MKAIHRALGTTTLLVAFGIQVAGDRRVCAQFQAPKEDAASVVTASGVVEAQTLVDVGTSVAGTIRKLGQGSNYAAVVKKGDVLAEVDSARYQADATIAKTQVQRAEAELVLAKAKVVVAERELEKARQLHVPDAVLAQAALDVAKASVAAAAADVAYRGAALARAEVDVASCTIRSPIDGVTIDRRVNVGQSVPVSPSEATLFLIASDLKKLDVWALVPEREIGRIAKGQPARFTVSAFPNETFKAAVKEIRLNAASQNSQVAYTVVLDCDNSDGRLLPYMSAKVTIEVGPRQ